MRAQANQQGTGAAAALGFGDSGTDAADADAGAESVASPASPGSVASSVAAHSLARLDPAAMPAAGGSSWALPGQRKHQSPSSSSFSAQGHTSVSRSILGSPGAAARHGPGTSPGKSAAAEAATADGSVHRQQGASATVAGRPSDTSKMGRGRQHQLTVGGSDGAAGVPRAAGASHAGAGAGAGKRVQKSMHRSDGAAAALGFGGPESSTSSSSSASHSEAGSGKAGRRAHGSASSIAEPGAAGAAEVQAAGVATGRRGQSSSDFASGSA